MTRRQIATFVTGALLGAAVLLPSSTVAQEQGAQNKAAPAAQGDCAEKAGCADKTTPVAQGDCADKADCGEKKAGCADKAAVPAAQGGCCGEQAAAPTTPVKDAPAASAAPMGDCGGCEGDKDMAAKAAGCADCGECSGTDAWMAAGTPGESHKKLEPMVGTWNVTQKFWMEPGQAPVESQATSEHTWALGGRFVEQRFSGSMPGMNTPFEGRGYTGFDNVTGKFVGMWMDSFSTSMLTFEGTVTPCGKLLTFRGEQLAPGNMKVKYRYQVQIESADRHVFTMWQAMGEAPEAKVMEAVYTKRSAAPSKK